MSSESSFTLVSSLNITLPSSLPPASVTLKFTQEVVATLCCLQSLEAFVFFFFSENVTPGCQLCSKSCFGNPASSGGVCCRYRKLHTGSDASLVFLFPKDEDEDRTLARWGGEAGAQDG